MIVIPTFPRSNSNVIEYYKDCGCTVLHAAAESGNEKMIQLFLPNAEIIDVVNKV